MGGVLTRASEERRLEDRAARTLALLCLRRGEIVSQQAILAEVWKSRAVSPNSVAVVIGDLRRALDEEARKPIYIETLPKRGYRLRCETAPEATGEDVAGPPLGAKLHRRILIAGGVAIGLGSLTIALRRASTPPALRIMSDSVENDTGRPELDRLARALGMLVDLHLTALPHVVVVKAPGGPDGLLFRSRLILWNAEPTLSLEAIKAATGTVVWAGMAEGPTSALAGNTIAQLRRFAAVSATLARAYD